MGVVIRKPALMREKDTKRAGKVVVFDDPFTSMDTFRRNHTVHQIMKCGETCAEVIVLSHEATVLHLLWDRLPTADRKTLWLARVGEENTTVAKWDIVSYAELFANCSALFANGENVIASNINKHRASEALDI